MKRLITVLGCFATLSLFAQSDLELLEKAYNEKSDSTLRIVLNKWAKPDTNFLKNEGNCNPLRLSGDFENFLAAFEVLMKNYLINPLDEYVLIPEEVFIYKSSYPIEANRNRENSDCYTLSRCWGYEKVWKGSKIIYLDAVIRETLSDFLKTNNGNDKSQKISFLSRYVPFFISRDCTFNEIFDYSYSYPCILSLSYSLERLSFFVGTPYYFQRCFTIYEIDTNIIAITDSFVRSTVYVDVNKRLMVTDKKAIKRFRKKLGNIIGLNTHIYSRS